MPGNFRQFAPGQHKQPGDEDRLGNLAVLIGGGLEGLTGSIREAIEVETIVPVRAADQRQSMRSKPVESVAEAALQVLIERRFGAGFVVVRNGLVENAPVASLLQIGSDAHDQPMRDRR